MDKGKHDAMPLQDKFSQFKKFTKICDSENDLEEGDDSKCSTKASLNIKITNEGEGSQNEQMMGGSNLFLKINEFH
jgi:hypothetical protein